MTNQTSDEQSLVRISHSFWVLRRFVWIKRRELFEQERAEEGMALQVSFAILN